MSERWARLAGAAFAGHVVLALYLVERVTINADEGWYLYAAGGVAEGLALHRDLLFFQAPVMPHVYGGMLDFGPGMLLGARWISLVFLILATGLGGLTALRLAGPRAAAVTLALTGLHPLVVGTGIWAKPYALAMFLLAGGLFLWSGPDRPLRVAAGALLMGLAAGVRLSLLPVPLVAIWVAGRRGWAVLGAVAGLALAYRPLLGVSPPILWEQLIGVHLPDSGDLLGQVELRAEMLIRLCILLAGPLAVAVIARCGRGQSWGPVQRLCLGAVVLVGLAHFVPGALHVEHVVVLMPFIGVLVGLWSRQVPDKTWAWLNVIVWAALGCMAATHMVQVDSGRTTLEQAAEVGLALREQTAPKLPILTLQTTLAVESGRRVPPGFEMGRFGWTLGGLDRAGVLDAASRPLGAVALAEGDFGDDPVLRLMLERAAVGVGRTQTIDRFGQFREPLLLGLPAAPTMVRPGEQP
jgi:hypothetical protein